MESQGSRRIDRRIVFGIGGAAVVVVLLALVAANTVLKDQGPAEVQAIIESLAGRNETPALAQWQEMGQKLGVATAPGDVTFTASNVLVEAVKDSDGMYTASWALGAARDGANLGSTSYTATFQRSPKDGTWQTLFVDGNTTSLAQLLPPVTSEAQAQALVLGIQPYAKRFGAQVSLSSYEVPGDPAPANQVINEKAWLQSEEETERQGQDGRKTHFALDDGSQIDLFDRVDAAPVQGIVHRGTLTEAEVQQGAADTLSSFVGFQRTGNLAKVKEILSGADTLEQSVLDSMNGDPTWTIWTDSLASVNADRLAVTGTRGNYQVEPGDTGVTLHSDVATGKWTISAPGFWLRAMQPNATATIPDSELCKSVNPSASLRVAADRVVYRLDAAPLLFITSKPMSDGEDCYGMQTLRVTEVNGEARDELTSGASAGSIAIELPGLSPGDEVDLKIGVGWHNEGGNPIDTAHLKFTLPQ